MSSIKATPAIDDGTTSLVATPAASGWKSTKTYSIDQDKVNKVGKELGELISEIRDDVEDYNEKKQKRDIQFIQNAQTNWTKEWADVDVAYAQAFNKLQKTAVPTQSGDWTTVKFDDANASVAKSFKTAVTKDMNLFKGMF